jgi:hypothetical protein
MGVKSVSFPKGRTQTEGVSERGVEKIFGSNFKEVTRGLRRLHDEEFHNL